MIRLIRVVLQVVLFFLLLSLMVGIASVETGMAEKVVLVALAAVVVWLASVVRRTGRPLQPRL